jgi:hypothetical protein
MSAPSWMEPGIDQRNSRLAAMFRDEEETQEQPAERLDLGGDRMPEGCFGQGDAAQESAKGERQANPAARPTRTERKE